jgi:hypothetical protein
VSIPITFSSIFKNYITEPIPAKKEIPEAYKNLENYVKDNIESPTVKKCIPFLDTYLSGYILKTHVDYLLKYDEEQKEHDFILPEQIRNNSELLPYLKIYRHNNYQVKDNLKYEKRTIDGIFKFRNLWKIKTPPGYSCLFTSPLNRNSSIKIIDGIVDTDSFEGIVEFPFYWINEKTNDVLLSADTPIVQIIPFKREPWKMKVEYDKDSHSSLNLIKIVNKFYDNYKTKFWNKKDFN